MRNLSSEWKEKIKNGMDVYYLKYADITLKDGTKLNFTNADFWQDGITFEDSVSSDNSFDIGSAIVNTLSLSINDFEGNYSDYDFEDAEVICYFGLETEQDVIEKIRICTMTVVEQPDTETVTLNLTCEDNMRKFDKEYSSSKLTYPATRKQIIQDACDVCGVTLQTKTFDREDYVVQIKPDAEKLTFRQVISWTAQLGCQWLRCDEYGRLCVGWYDTDENNTVLIDGTYNFTPKHTDVVITGVRVTEYAESSEEEEASYMSGTEGYIIDISENKLIRKGDGQTIASMIAEKCVGMLFRPFEATCITDVALEAGDPVEIIDRNGNIYKSVITSTTLQPGKGQAVACGAESALKNSSVQYSKTTQNFVAARKMVQKERTDREKALEELGKQLETVSGVYTTIEVQEDGSKVFYLHNKPKLSDSMMVWKMTAEAWAVSTDGGETWNGGMTVDGDTIVRILTATGVNAEWINAGAITVKDDSGNIIFNVDMDTKRVIISGDHVQIGGKTATTAIDDAVSEAKNYSDEKLSDYADTVSKSISGLQNQIDGQVETFFYDYEPTLQNIPASEWTTTAEREKHEGDLFFWKSTGYAYRFTKDGDTWKWQVVQDTDITKALAAAENAQETANNKRRVFVVQPTPPYDIGDLWTQEGGDILTCTTARGKGASYVSSDWEKLNKYTDDTVANEALNAAALARNMTMQLTNDYQSITTDADGNIVGSFPTAVTRAIVMYGTSDITNDCTYNITKSDNLTGTWDLATHSYTVTGITADDAWVDIRATYLSNLSVTKRFTVVKLKAGKSGRTYFIEPSYNVLKRSADGSMIPSVIEFNAYYRDGISETRTSYNGKFVLEETKDGETWETVYSSSENESSVTHYLYTLLSDEQGNIIVGRDGETLGLYREIASIRCKLYSQNDSSIILDMKTIPVVYDVESLSQQQIVEILSNNGEWRGLYYLDGKLYISFDAALGGSLTLGGENNGNGRLEIVDSKGKSIGYIDNTGVNFEKGNFAGEINGSVVKGSTIISDDKNTATQIKAGAIRLRNTGLDSEAYIEDEETGELVYIGTENANWNDRNDIANAGYVQTESKYYPDFAESTVIIDDNVAVMSLDAFWGLFISAEKSQIAAFGKNTVNLYGNTTVEKNLTVDGDIDALGNNGQVHCKTLWTNSLIVDSTKSRYVETNNYQKQYMHAFETPTPMFADIGCGQTNEEGIDVIPIHDMFLETVNTNIEYQVFLQKEGAGDVWVDEKSSLYFVVKGTPNLKYSWEIKALQKDYEYIRFEDVSIVCTDEELQKEEKEMEEVQQEDLKAIDEEERYLLKEMRCQFNENSKNDIVD